MMLRIRLARAFVCYWAMEIIGLAVQLLPKRYRCRVIDALAGVLSYGAYWRFRTNPKVRAELSRRGVEIGRGG